jgi:hypothetical protein
MNDPQQISIGWQTVNLRGIDERAGHALDNRLDRSACTRKFTVLLEREA